MPTNKLRYFVAIAQAGSLSRAAQALGIAQSALSRHMADLESSIGGQLFTRTGKGVELSPLGHVLLEDAQTLLAQFDRTFEHLRVAAKGSSGRLTIAFNALTARFPPVLEAIAKFVKQNPDVSLRLPIMRSIEQVAHLRDRRIDAGFLFDQSHSLPELNRFTVGFERFRVALHEMHPLAARQELSLASLDGLACVLISTDSAWTPQSRILQQCNAHGFRPDVRLEVASQQLQLDLIGQGLGYGFVNASAADILPARVVLRRVTELRDRMALDFVFPRNRRNPLVDKFRAELTSAVTKAEKSD